MEWPAHLPLVRGGGVSQPVDTPIQGGMKLCVEPNQIRIDKGRYHRLVGRLLYLAHTRPDLVYTLSLVTWKSKKQNVVVRLSVEAKFGSMTLGLYEALWLRLLLQDLGYLFSQPIQWFCDSKGSCDIAHNLIQHDHTKRVEVDSFFIKKKLDLKIV